MSGCRIAASLLFAEGLKNKEGRMFVVYLNLGILSTFLFAENIAFNEKHTHYSTKWFISILFSNKYSYH